MDANADLRSLAAAERLVRPSGLSLNHVATLDLLARHDSLSSGDVAKELGLSPATVTRCTDKLVAFHMIRASLDPEDLRRNLFRLEGRGRGVLFEIRKSMAPGGSLDDALGLHRMILRAAGTGSAALSDARLSPAAVRALLALGAGPCAVRELARRTGLRQSSASMACSALREASLARPLAQPAGDGRERRYGLTAQGASALDTFLAGLNAEKRTPEQGK